MIKKSTFLFFYQIKINLGRGLHPPPCLLTLSIIGFLTAVNYTHMHDAQ